VPERTIARLLEDRGRALLLFERVLAHTPQRVWDALTAPGDLAHWHPTPFELEPRVGGTVTFLPTPDAPSMAPGSVLDYEPPRRLAYTWGDDELRFEVRDHPEGCLLVLAHGFDDRFKAARDASGWELCLQALRHHLRGERPPGLAEGERLPSGWCELNADYERRFGIAPEDATPPPRRPA
jgi:uncharacterized protein YndB with AHSA1/START domain